MPEPRPAVFLDRDGTLVDDPGFLHRPADVRLFPGAARAVRRLRGAGYAVVTVSNQSGIARGVFGETDYRAVERRLAELLRAEGTALDGAYFCPHHPDFTGPCECRKPAPKLFLDAQRELGLDLGRSWFVGDRVSDATPAAALGGRGLLVLTGHGRDEEAAARAAGIPVVPDLAAAADRILGAPKR